MADDATRRNGHAPVRVDLFYSFSTAGQMMLAGVVGSWLLYRYLPPDGKGMSLVPAAWVGVVLFLSRLVDALVDPPIGYLSDRTRTRWGRRIPYMFAAGIPTLILFYLLWTPPVAGQSFWNLAYLGGVTVLFNLVFSVMIIPFNALLPEIARTERHRVRISAFYSGAQLIGMILASFAGYLLEGGGYRTMALVYGGIALVLFYLPFVGLRERTDRVVASDQSMGLTDSLLTVLRNRPFRYWVVTWALYWIASTMLQSVIPYIATEICLASEAESMVLLLPAILVSLACYPLVVALSRRFGKWRVFMGSLLAGAVILPLLMVIGPAIPAPLLVQGVVWICLQAAALSGTTVLPTAFGAEVVDHDARITGQRREGIYYAAWGLLDQAINGAAMALLPLLMLLGRSHSDVRGPLGIRLVGLIGGLFLLAAFLVFRRYPLRPGGAQGHPASSSTEVGLSEETGANALPVP